MVSSVAKRPKGVMPSSDQRISLFPGCQFCNPLDIRHHASRHVVECPQVLESPQASALSPERLSIEGPGGPMPRFPGDPRMSPRGSRGFQLSFSRSQKAPKTPQKGSRRPPRRSKRAPRQPKSAPRRGAPKTPQGGLKMPQQRASRGTSRQFPLSVCVILTLSPCLP